MSVICEKTEKRRFIEASCIFTNKDNPFSQLQIDDSSFLDLVSYRGSCPKCNKSRRYYCYNCYVPVYEIQHKIPKVKLPVKIDIIKHPKEVDGKSTSAHASVLAAEDVRVFTYPNVPSYEQKRALLIFPGKSAVELKDVCLPAHSIESEINCDISKDTCNAFASADTSCNHQCICCQSYSPIQLPHAVTETGRPITAKHPHPFLFDTIVFIDSTWKQTKRLYRDPQIRSLPCAVLTNHRSVFWRHQRGKPENYLSTIEAVYYFLVELHQLQFPGVPYCGRYDNLLFFFKFMYYKIRTLYDPTTLKAYQQQHSASQGSEHDTQEDVTASNP